MLPYYGGRHLQQLFPFMYIGIWYDIFSNVEEP